MIRATLDTNVLAAGVVTSAQTVNGQVIQAWRDNKYILVLSEAILTEFSRTLLQPYFSARLTARLTAAQIEATLNLFRREATIVPSIVTVKGVATHPEDDLILATALSGKAHYLVTRDEKLQTKVQGYKGVSIISPPVFLQRLRDDAKRAA
jgi:putative PIN family toxin of toxin-antitoxin system